MEVIKAPAIFKNKKTKSTEGQNSLKLLSKKNRQSSETLPQICCQSNKTRLEISKITLRIREERHA